MEYLKLGIDIFLIIAFFSFILRPFLPDRYNEIAETIGMRVLMIIVGTPLFLKNLWVFSSTIAYFLGMFLILALLVIGVILFTYTLSLQIGLQNSFIQPIYDIIVVLSQNKAAWAGATIVIATTVAIGHMWNLRLNLKKFDGEMSKLRREEREILEERVKKYRGERS